LTQSDIIASSDINIIINNNLKGKWREGWSRGVGCWKRGEEFADEE
jgi:hypothetical protein